MTGAMAVRSIVTAAALLLAASCGATADGPPPIAVDRTPCSRCGMLISELLYAAAYQVPGEAARVFDDLGCLREAARAERVEPRVWVRDVQSGEWIDGSQARFISAPTIRTPMGGGILAYGNAADAERAAVKYRASVVPSLSALLARTGAGS